ncbi:hypothetical protein GUITHDRAFT_142561 [Guillardia theta CCMP2712]|uniref:Thiaminase-2/PQQC domain-containing protein n=1 Tax=Guillardia theta (strain CCMP2712) TaxID=905079 RepID=L1IX50_GUITC|nr:hypothetical protein GUITHDRAFT_142561 [Guillardia theta CCMP2712]EKX40687.1 hypothetical protein GUITHDRAFT_142561 [Guillardia theta CCMP2712]|eukprot:XP_005827667.1 hypothetical protein GUITHDRAFT_142561 [Guillardia theta CCMP2712]
MERISSIRNSIIQMSFIRELIDGSLSKERFRFYIIQDSLYLKEYSKVLAMLAAKAPNPSITQTMALASNSAVSVEGSLHDSFLKQLNVTDEIFKSTEQSRTSSGYTDFLMATVASRPYEVAFAAVIPCYTIYHEAKVGNYIQDLSHKNSADIDKNPFKDWIRTYGGEEFDIATKKAVSIVDDLARKASSEVRKEMLEAFMTAARFEWMFWDSAYQLEQWPIDIRNL